MRSCPPTPAGIQQLQLMETHIGIKVAENLRTGKVTGNRRTGSKVARKSYRNKVAESRARRKFTIPNHMQSHRK